MGFKDKTEKIKREAIAFRKHILNQLKKRNKNY